MSIAPISLAGFYTNSSGAGVLSGLSSGLNTQSVIQSLTAAQSAQVTQINDQVSVDNKQISALGQLQSLLTTLQSTTSALSSPDSPDTTDNLWAVRTSTITSNTTQPASNYLTATVASGTAVGSYTISDISKIATYSTQQTSTTFSSASTSVVASSATTGEFTAGTFTLAGPLGSGSVTLNSGDNLSQVASDFNSESSVTGISASVVQTSPGTYILAFSSTETGLASSFDLTTTGSSGTVPSSGNPSNVFQNISFGTAVGGEDAMFQLNGVSIDRATNNISDLISGVTINLLQNTVGLSGASFTINVTPDTTNISQGIDAFATAYNNFLAFYAQQTQLNSSGTPASSAILYSDTTLRNIFNEMTQQANSVVNGLTNSVPNSLAGVGISFTTTPATSTTPAVSNSLSVDNNTLISLLQGNFSEVENVFGANLTSSSPQLALFQPPTTQSVSNFTININQTGSVYTATYTATGGGTDTVTLSATSLTSGGIALTAPEDSVFAGLELIYGSSSNANIPVTLTQGIASAMNNSITAALTPNTGLIATDESGIQTNITTLQTQATNVSNQLTTTRNQLLQQFSALESSVNQANSILDLLNAQSAVSSGSSG